MINFDNVAGAQKLAQAIVNTIPEPFIVLDDRLHVLAANRSFYETFAVDPVQTKGRLFFSLDNGQWDIPALRDLLKSVIPKHANMDGFEVEYDFPALDRRTMLLNARQVVYDGTSKSTILLAFLDVTERRNVEREKDDLLKQIKEWLRQKDVLLQEIQHRVANSLQIIASILLLKARAVTSEETRHHLQDAHQRVMSVAEIQRHLHPALNADEIDVDSYLSKLCASLASSMVAETQRITVKVIANKGSVRSDKAVSIGLIVTELVINAIKYAFPLGRPDAQILIAYEIDDQDWKLIVSDNGVGKHPTDAVEVTSGLGTAIIEALVRQLDARIEVASDVRGTKVSITRATFTSRMPHAA